MAVMTIPANPPTGGGTGGGAANPNPFANFRSQNEAIGGGYNPLQYANLDTTNFLARNLGANAVRTRGVGSIAAPDQNMLDFGGGNMHNAGLVGQMFERYGPEQAQRMLQAEIDLNRQTGHDNSANPDSVFNLSNLEGSYQALPGGFQGRGQGASQFAPTVRPPTSAPAGGDPTFRTPGGGGGGFGMGPPSTPGMTASPGPQAPRMALPFQQAPLPDFSNWGGGGSGFYGGGLGPNQSGGFPTGGRMFPGGGGVMGAPSGPPMDLQIPRSPGMGGLNPNLMNAGPFSGRGPLPQNRMQRPGGSPAQMFRNSFARSPQFGGGQFGGRSMPFANSNYFGQFQ